MAVPVTFSGSPGDSCRLPPPRLGEHNAEILREIGCTEAEIAEIIAAGLAS